MIVPMRDRPLRDRPLHSMTLLFAACVGCDARNAGDAMNNAETKASFAGQVEFHHTVQEHPDVILHDLGDVVVFEDGRMVVANNSVPSLVWIDHKGQISAETGRRGKGPGEFERVTALRRVGNTVIAWDQVLRRLTFYSDRAELKSITSLDLAGAWRLVGAADINDLTLVRVEWDGVRREYMRVTSARQPLERWITEGRPRPTVSYLSTDTRTGRNLERHVIMPQCMPSTLDLYSDGKLYTADTGEGAMRTAGSPRTAPALVYRATGREKFGEAARAEIKRRARDIPPDSLESAFRRAGGDDGHLPAWRNAFATDGGLLFLQRAVCSADNSFEQWEIVDVNNRTVTRIKLPERARLKGASGEWLAVITLDEFETERLEIHRLSRN